MLADSDVAEVFRRLAESDPMEDEVPVKVRRDAFRSAVSCILSAQSPDARTAEATNRLFAVARTPEAILGLPVEALTERIRPAGLYNMKAKNIRAMCRDLIDRFDGVVPQTRKELMSLPGIGRKCADILLRFVFHHPIVAVDTHVHRVCNRLGLASGKTEAQTAASLEPRVPPEHALHAHVRLIHHGKRTCKPRPRCGACLLVDLCETGPVGAAAS